MSVAEDPKICWLDILRADIYKRRPKPATARGARDMDAKTLCLGVLSRGAASGYEIKKAFEEGPFSHFHQASFGSIYPALNALSADGLVAVDRKSTRLNSSH